MMQGGLEGIWRWIPQTRCSCFATPELKTSMPSGWKLNNELDVAWGREL